LDFVDGLEDAGDAEKINKYRSKFRAEDDTLLQQSQVENKSNFEGAACEMKRGLVQKSQP
jgi:hypothetical protein